MKRLTFIVIAAAVLWSGYWFWMANAQKSAFESWFELRRNEGWAADYSELSVMGFPNRLDTTLSDPRLGDPESGLLWESPFLQLFQLTYNPKHLIAAIANEQIFATPYEQIDVSTTDARASLKLKDISSWTPERMILVAEDLQIQSDQNWNLAAELAQLSFEAIPETTSDYRLALDARGLKGSLPNWITVSGTGDQPPIDRLVADVEVRLTEALSRSTVENHRPQPRLITVKLAEAEWSGLKLAGAGQLEITESGTPVGTLTVKVRNWREMLKAERAAGRLSVSAMKQVDFILTLISGLSGNPETLDLPFDFERGQVFLGPLSLGEAPRLVIP